MALSASVNWLFPGFFLSVNATPTLRDTAGTPSSSIDNCVAGKEDLKLSDNDSVYEIIISEDDK